MTPLRKNFFITLGIVSVIALFFFGFFIFLLEVKIYPFSNTFLDTEKSIRITEANLNTYDKTVLPELEKSKADIDAIENLFFVFGNDEKSLQLIYFFEDLISTSGLEKVAITPPTQVKGIKEAVVSVSVRGDYVSMIRFLRRLENSKYLITITNLQMNNSSAQLDLHVGAL